MYCSDFEGEKLTGSQTNYLTFLSIIKSPHLFVEIPDDLFVEKGVYHIIAEF